MKGKIVKRISAIAATVFMSIAVMHVAAGAAGLNPNAENEKSRYGTSQDPEKYFTVQNKETVDKIYEALNKRYPNMRDTVRAKKWCAHAGYSNLAPRNSAAAFVLAGKCGASSCEGDVRITSDGGLVMIHDEDVSSLTDSVGNVKSMKFEDVVEKKITKRASKKFLTGMSICDFSTYLDICRNYGMYPYIHLKEVKGIDKAAKEQGIANFVNTIYDKKLMNDVIVISSEYEGLRLMRDTECNLKGSAKIHIKPIVGENNQQAVKDILTIEPKDLLFNKYNEVHRAKWGASCCADYPFTAGVRSLSIKELGVSFTERGILIDDAVVRLDATSFAYTGKEIKPTPTVTLKGTVLQEKNEKNNENYVVKYENNRNVGTATVKVYGANDYNGEAKAMTFKITPADINETTVKGLKSVMYDGKAKVLDLTLSYKGKKLTEGTDYTVSYSGNTNVGTATVKITGKGNFKGTRTETFEITRIPVSKATSASISGEVYDGQKHLPKPSLTYAGKTLVEGKNYTLSYKNNVNFGTAEITVTGIGVFEGTKTLSFKILQASVAKATVEEIQDKVYNGKAYAPNPAVTRDGRTLKKGTDYTIAYENNLNAGTAIVTIEGKGNYVGSIKKKFTIAPRSIAKNSSVITMYSIPTQVYNGKARTPVPVVLLNGETELKKGKHFNVTYENNVNKGTAKATVTGIGNFTGKRTLSFKIVDESVYENAESFIEVKTVPLD